MSNKFVSSTTGTACDVMLIPLAGIVSLMMVGPMITSHMAFAFKGPEENSMDLGDVGLTNLDIPSIDFTLPDGSSVSPDFRSIYFYSGGEGETIYAYYNDYELPEDKPQLKVGDEFNVDAYLSHANTPKPENIDISISKIFSGNETGNFTTMTLDKPLNVTSSGNTYEIPETAAGNYILDTFVSYPFGGIVLVYTIEIQLGA